MKLSRISKALVIVGIVSLFAFSLAACKSDPNAGVAATVNGTEIKEQAVTDQIQHVRAQSGLNDDEQWGKFLVQNDMTPSSVRDTIIDTMVEQELIKQGAAELGISVEDSEVQEAIDSFKQNYSTDSAWKDALEQAGFTEETYHQTIEESMLEKKVGEHFEGQSETTEEDYVQSAQTYATYYNGAKHVSEILFVVNNPADEDEMKAAKEKAADVLAQINAGTLDFADAAKQYSGKEGAAENGGDIGWDKIDDFNEDVVTVLTDLEVGQISEPTEGDGGVFIVKVTEVYTAPEDSSTITSLDQIPAAFQENIKDMAKSVQANTKYTEWLDQLKENADIVKNDMPEGLPYDIDLTPYQTESSEAAADGTTTDTTATTDGTETAEGTATTEGDAATATAEGSGTETTTTTDATTTANGESSGASASEGSASSSGSASSN